MQRVDEDAAGGGGSGGGGRPSTAAPERSHAARRVRDTLRVTAAAALQADGVRGAEAAAVDRADDLQQQDICAAQGILTRCGGRRRYAQSSCVSSSWTELGRAEANAARRSDDVGRVEAAAARRTDELGRAAADAARTWVEVRREEAAAAQRVRGDDIAARLDDLRRSRAGGG